MSPNSALHSFANPMAGALPFASVFPAFSSAAHDAVARDLVTQVAGNDKARTAAGRNAFNALETDRQQDRLVCLLMADLLHAEIAAHDAATPSQDGVTARCVLGLRVLRPAMMRQGHDLETLETDPVAIARVMVERVEASKTDADRQMLLASRH